MLIITQLRLIVVVLFIFGVIGNVSVYWQLNKMTSDGRVVNFAGIVRGATQRLVKLELAGKKAEADPLRARLDQIVNGLINGDVQLMLPQATDVDFLSKMRLVEQAWEGLKQTMTKARVDASVRDALLQESENYFKLTNDAVFAAEEFSKEKVTTLKTVQLIIFLINMVLLLFIWIMSQKKIAQPLSYLTERVQKVVNGDFSVEVDYKSNDEIGNLAKNLNKMVQSFRVCIRKLYPEAYKE